MNLHPSGAALTRISVVIPSYNRREALLRAIASAQAQLQAGDEVWVIDDASADGSAEAARLAGAQVIACPNNVGVSRARNLGARAAAGEILLFLDDDDLLLPEALALTRAAHARAGAQEVAFWGAVERLRFDAAGQVLETRALRWQPEAQRSSSRRFRHLLEVAVSYGFSIRREVFLTIDGFDEGLRQSEDRELLLHLTEIGASIGYIDALLVQRQEFAEQSLSRPLDAERYPAHDLLVLSRYRNLLERPELKEVRQLYLESVARSLYRCGKNGEARALIAKVLKAEPFRGRAWEIFLKYQTGYGLLRDRQRRKRRLGNES